jgi:hypothetical protein
MNNPNENEVRDEAPRLEPVVEMNVTYSRSGDRFVLTQTVDGRQQGTKPATPEQFLLCEILRELRALNASCEQERRIEELAGKGGK